MFVLGKTDIGKFRDENQDRFRVSMIDDNTSVAVVCDGMGGAKSGGLAGDIASDIVYERLCLSYRADMEPKSVKSLLVSAFSAANSVVYRRSHEEEENRGMGTTCVAAIVDSGRVYVAHVGDSRAYIISADGNLKQLTRDHSMVQDLVESGELTPEEAKNFPGKNIITRAIGVDGRVTVDFDESDFAHDDILILCSDGLTNYVSDEEIVSVASASTCFEYAEKLVNLANENGGGDNITVVSIVS